MTNDHDEKSATGDAFQSNFRTKIRKFAIGRLYGGPLLLVASAIAAILQFLVLKGLWMRISRWNGDNFSDATKYIIGFIALEYLVYPLVTHVAEQKAWDIGNNTEYTGSSNYVAQGFRFDISVVKIIFALGPRPFWLGVFHIADGIRLLAAMPPKLLETAALFAAHREDMTLDDAAEKLGYNPARWIKLLDQAGAIVHLPSRNAWKLTDRFR